MIQGKPSGVFVIHAVLNLFRCSHRRLTHPVTPIAKVGQPHTQSYVFCLNCGQQFEYDLNERRIGKVIDHSHDASLVPPRRTKVKYALLAAVPAAITLGAVLKHKKRKAMMPESAERDASGQRKE
jgi:hypothetical protein